MNKTTKEIHQTLAANITHSEQRLGELREKLKTVPEEDRTARQALIDLIDSEENLQQKRRDALATSRQILESDRPEVLYLIIAAVLGVAALGVWSWLS